MFGRRKREEAAAADAAREEDRRVLFSKLAERPEHVCPFLGLAGERSEYIEGISDEHRCFAFGDPAPISAERRAQATAIGQWASDTATQALASAWHRSRSIAGARPT